MNEGYTQKLLPLPTAPRMLRALRVDSSNICSLDRRALASADSEPVGPINASTDSEPVGPINASTDSEPVGVSMEAKALHSFDRAAAPSRPSFLPACRGAISSGARLPIELVAWPCTSGSRVVRSASPWLGSGRARLPRGGPALVSREGGGRGQDEACAGIRASGGHRRAESRHNCRTRTRTRAHNAPARARTHRHTPVPGPGLRVRPLDPKPRTPHG